MVENAGPPPPRNAYSSNPSECSLPPHKWNPGYALVDILSKLLSRAGGLNARCLYLEFDVRCLSSSATTCSNLAFPGKSLVPGGSPSEGSPASDRRTGVRPPAGPRVPGTRQIACVECPSDYCVRKPAKTGNCLRVTSSCRRYGLLRDRSTLDSIRDVRMDSRSESRSWCFLLTGIHVCSNWSILPFVET